MDIGFAREQESVPQLSAEEELTRLMNEHEHVLFNFLLGLVRDHDVAADCLQETFIRTYQHLQSGRTCNRRWLFTVARNQALQDFRRRRRLAPEPETEHASPEFPFDQRLAVQDIMNELPIQDREVLYLYEVAGWKTHEIAEILGARPVTVRQRLSRARARFRVLYEGKGPEATLK